MSLKSYLKLLFVVFVIHPAFTTLSFASLKKEVNTTVDYDGKIIKSAGIMLVTIDEKTPYVVLGLTTSSLKEKKSPDGGTYMLKPEYSPASGHIDESDKVMSAGDLNALETIKKAMNREVREELGEAGYDYIFKNGILSEEPVVSEKRAFYILTVTKPLAEVIDTLNQSIKTIPVDEREFKEVSAFPLKTFINKELVDFGRYPLTDTQNLVKYYDKAVLMATEVIKSMQTSN